MQVLLLIAQRNYKCFSDASLATAARAGEGQSRWVCCCKWFGGTSRPNKERPEPRDLCAAEHSQMPRGWGQVTLYLSSCICARESRWL